MELGILKIVDEGKSTATPDSSSGDHAGSPTEAFRKLMAVLPRTKPGSVSQRQVLRHIQQQEGGTTVTEMAQHFKTTGMSIGGIITGGIQRNIKKAGLQLESILRIEQEGGEWHFYPGALLATQEPVPA